MICPACGKSPKSSVDRTIGSGLPVDALTRIRRCPCGYVGVTEERWTATGSARCTPVGTERAQAPPVATGIPLASAGGVGGGPSPIRSGSDPYPKGSIQEISTSAELARRDSTPAVEASPAGVPVVIFDCVGKGPRRFAVTSAFLDEARPAYPAIDVELEVRQALIWTRANPTRRKTARGMPAFLVGWLARAQNRAARGPAPNVPRDTRCGLHQRNPNVPSRYPSTGCDRCQHFTARNGTRTGEPTAATDALPAWATAPAPAAWTEEQKAEAARLR